jgi:[histone H3]-lysine36 N-dimethyltransferase SETMAR
MKKVTSRWIPHKLTDEQKQQRVKLSRENLAKFRDGSSKLCDIITVDETWIYHRQVGRKSTNASWVSEGESPTTIVRRSKFEPKNLFCIIFKSDGPVRIHAVDKGETIDHNYYIENCLKPVVKEIWKQRKPNGTKGIKLLDDNAGPHRHSDVINYLTEEHINNIHLTLHRVIIG